MFFQVVARTAVAMLSGLARLVPPRVWACISRALCNGWMTGRRMQRAAPCVFGCGAGEDSLEHYSCCGRVAAFGRRRLGLAQPPPAERLSSFLLLSPAFSEHTSHELARRALASYSVYAAANAARHGLTTDANEAMAQFAREACAAHAGLATVVASIWQS